MQNAGLGGSQAGIKIDGRNINNLRYADDTTLKAKSEEELKSLLMKVKVKEKSEKAGLRLNILFAGQQWKNRHTEQTYGHGQREGEDETYGKSNMETYITTCKIGSQREFAVWLRKLK